MLVRFALCQHGPHAVKSKLAGLRVLITGAAQGVGLECARAFADHGCDLILCDNDGVGLTNVSDRLSSFSSYCDVTSEASVVIFAAKIADTFESFDVLINAAGSGYARALGMMRMSHALLPSIRRATGNRFIFNIKPSEDVSPAEMLFHYASSRTGFARLSEALAEQTKGSAIHVETVTPNKFSNRFRDIAAGSVGETPQPKAIDASETAQRILSIVRTKRPEWRVRLVRRERRA